MKDVLDSIFHQFNNRMKTTFYGLLGSWLVLLHWEFFYTLFFVDEQKILDKTGLLKNEYLRQHFMPGGPEYWLLQAVQFMLALLMTFIMIFVIPRYVLERVYKSEKDHEAAKRKIKLDAESKLVQEQAEAQKATTIKLTELETQVKKQNTVRKRIADKDPTVLWDTDYESLKKLDIYEYFDQLIVCLYQYGGRVLVSGVQRDVFHLDRDLLAYADANGLVEYDRKEGRVSPTEKGKYFIKLYQAENNR